MYEWIAKSVWDLFTGTAQDKERAQEQLKPVLDLRFQPCLKLWGDLWKFADNFEKKDGNQDIYDIRQLSETVDTFMDENGALISVRCLMALLRLQKSLREIEPGEEDNRTIKVRNILSQLFPSPEKDAGGKVVGQNPGLLMLLRDEIGSNAKAASSILK